MEPVPGSDGGGGNCRPSVAPSLSSNLQRDFEVDAASSFSLPLSSNAPTVSQMLLSEDHLLSAEEKSHNMPEHFRSHDIFYDSWSFGQMEAAPSGSPVDRLAPSPEVLAPDSPPQMQVLDPELDLSGVLWPSSPAPSLSVRRFLVHLPSADMWAPEGPPVATVSHHLHHQSPAVCTETLPVAMVTQEQMVGEGQTPVCALTPPSQDDHALSVTFHGALLGLQQTVSPALADALAGYNDAFNYPASPEWTPSVMTTTQTLVLCCSPSVHLGSRTLQRASGLDYLSRSGFTERPGGGSAHLGAQVFGEMLNVSQSFFAQKAEEPVDDGGPPPLPSSSVSPSLSALLAGRTALASVSAGAAEAERGSLLSSRLVAGFHQHTTTQSLPDPVSPSLPPDPAPSGQYDDDDGSSGTIRDPGPSPEASEGKLLLLSAAEAADPPALNAHSLPVEMQTTSPCPTSPSSYQPGAAVTQQTAGAPVIPNPLPASGLNIPSFKPVPAPPTGPSDSAPGQGLVSGFDGLPPPDRDHHSEDTAASEAGGLEAPQGNVSADHLNSTPSVLNHSGSSGASWVNAHLSPTLPGLVGAAPFGSSIKKATTRPGSSAPGLTTTPAWPCQCKQRSHFPCVCGRSSGTSTSRKTKTL